MFDVFAFMLLMAVICGCFTWFVCRPRTVRYEIIEADIDTEVNGKVTGTRHVYQVVSIIGTTSVHDSYDTFEEADKVYQEKLAKMGAIEPTSPPVYEPKSKYDNWMKEDPKREYARNVVRHGVCFNLGSWE